MIQTGDSLIKTLSAYVPQLTPPPTTPVAPAPTPESIVLDVLLKRRHPTPSLSAVPVDPSSLAQHVARLVGGGA